MADRWNLRQVKRTLSMYEKETVPSTSGRALILPGEPHTEVEELVNIGFDPMQIVCVEQDQVKADRLYEHYVDDCHIHWEEVGKFMSVARGTYRYSYLHLDYCGHLKRPEIQGMQHWQRLMGDTARIRVSVFRGMRQDKQFSLEDMLHDSLLVRLCEHLAERDPVDPDRWVALRDAFAESFDDTTQIVLAIALFNFFFGVHNIWDYTDTCTENGMYLPQVEGRHLLTNIHRFTYNEPNQPNWMYTCWADLVPIPNETVRRSPEWTYNEVAKVFKALATAVPQYNPHTYRRN